MTDLADSLELQRELGRGVTGIVHLARLREPLGDLRTGSPIAVKVLDGEAARDPRARDAFRREEDAGRSVDHPGLVRVLGVGELNSEPALLLRYAEGQSLREFLEESGPASEESLRALGAVLSGALSALHDAGWAHGDVKPENVRIGDSAVLLDLGFARRLDGDLDAPRSGSLPYLAPERTSGGPATAESDVFALGVILHELATGQHPFAPLASRDPELWLGAMRDGGEVQPSRVHPRLSPLFDALVADMLAADPLDRPAARDVEEALSAGETSAWWCERRTANRLTPQPAGGSMPFVGRDHELQTLEAALEQADRGRGGMIWLEAPDGMGKGRLVDVFLRRARLGASQPLVLRERCTPQEQERSEQPIRVLLRQYLQLARREPAGPRARALLDAILPPRLTASLTRSLDATAGTPEVAETTSLAQWLLALGRSRLTIVYIEGIDHADDPTLEILSRVAEDLEGTRLLLLLSARGSTTRGRRRARRRMSLAGRATSRMTLSPLKEADVLEVVLQLFGEDNPRRRLARVLMERSGGSPDALGDQLASMQTRGQIWLRPDGRMDLQVPPEEIQVPDTLRRATHERLGELPERDRTWLERFSVMGGAAEPQFLSEAWEETTAGELDQVLSRLRTTGWLVPFGGQNRFARPSLRDAVYDSIPVERRSRMHHEAAEALATAVERRPSQSLSFQRAQQLRAVGQHGEVLETVSTLLDDPRTRSVPGRARTLARWGLEAVEELGREGDPVDPRVVLHLLELGTDAADRLGARNDQRRLLDQLSNLSFDPDEDTAEVARVYLLHGQYAMTIGQYGLSRGWLETAASMFERAGEPEREAVARLRLATLQGHVGALAEAETLARTTLRLSSTSQVRGRACGILAAVALLRDEFELTLRLVDRALHHLREAPEDATAHGDLAEVYLLQARTYRVVGRPRRASTALERAREHANRSGDRRIEVDAGARQGRLLVDMRQEREAELELREARVTALEIEYPRGEALASLFLGTLLAENDEPEAPRILERTTELAKDIGAGRVEALGLALRARLAIQAADLEVADGLSQKAHRLFSRLGGELADRVVVEATRALVLEGIGRISESEALMVALERRVRRVNEAIRAPVLRQRHRRATGSLLKAARTTDGPVYPRLGLRQVR